MLFKESQATQASGWWVGFFGKRWRKSWQLSATLVSQSQQCLELTLGLCFDGWEFFFTTANLNNWLVFLNFCLFLFLVIKLIQAKQIVANPEEDSSRKKHAFLWWGVIVQVRWSAQSLCNLHFFLLYQNKYSTPTHKYWKMSAYFTLYMTVMTVMTAWRLTFPTNPINKV